MLLGRQKATYALILISPKLTHAEKTCRQNKNKQNSPEKLISPLLWRSSPVVIFMRLFILFYFLAASTLGFNVPKFPRKHPATRCQPTGQNMSLLSGSPPPTSSINLSRFVKYMSRVHVYINIYVYICKCGGARNA